MTLARVTLPQIDVRECGNMIWGGCFCWGDSMIRTALQHRRTLIALATFLLISLHLGSPAASAYPSPYDAPTKIDLVPGNQSVRVAWPGFTVDANYVREFRVVASPGSSSCTAAITTDTCTVTGLVNGTAYTFAVFVVGVNGITGPANIAGPAWPCCSIPDPPTNVQGQPQQGAAIVSWSPPGNAQAAGHDFTYTVTTSPEGGQCSTRENSCRVEGLEDGTGYVFKVSATNSQGTGSPGMSSTVTPIGPPGAPTNVRVFLKPKGVATVSWLGPSKTGGLVVNKYIATATPGGATCESSGALTCNVKGLSNGVTYRFTVTAYNSSGAGPLSTTSGVAKPLAGPTQPLQIRAQLNTSAATVSWKAPKSTGGLPISDYVVRSSPSGLSCKTKATACTIRGLKPSTTYIFTVEARNKKSSGQPGQSSAYRTWTPSPSVEPTTPEKPEPVLS